MFCVWLIWTIQMGHTKMNLLNWIELNCFCGDGCWFDFRFFSHSFFFLNVCGWLTFDKCGCDLWRTEGRSRLCEWLRKVAGGYADWGWLDLMSVGGCSTFGGLPGRDAWWWGTSWWMTTRWMSGQKLDDKTPPFPEELRRKSTKTKKN